MTLLSAFATLLFRYTEQVDLLVGTPIANRRYKGLEGLIGCFINTLLLRVYLSGEPTFRVLLRRVREFILQAYAHQDLPFERLVDALAPTRDLSHSPLVQVLFVLQNAPREPLELPGLHLHFLDMAPTTAKFELTLMLQETEQGIEGILEYNRDLFEAATIERMATHYQTLLAGIVADPERRLSCLPLLTAQEELQLLREWNATGVDYPQDCCLHQLVEAQVERTPDAIALVYAGEHLSYCQLNERANQLAHHLHHLGVTPEVLVGVCLERSVDLARYLADGAIEFVGRLDQQVKLRGYRIELGEIEAALGSHEQVSEVVVQLRGEGVAEKRLVDYVVLKPGRSASVSELRGYLEARLPQYMVPAVFVWVEALPLLPNGKLDRRALPEPGEARPQLEEQYVSPCTPEEEILVGIWSQVLGIEQVGLFINTLPVRVQVAPTDLLLPWLQALQAHQLEVRQYEYSSLPQIHTWSGVPQHLPLFESLMMFENYPVDISLQKVGKSLNTGHALAQKNYGQVQTEVPLVVDVRPAQELALSIFYYRSYFEDSMIARMLEQFQVLLEGIAAEPGRHLGHLMHLVDPSILGSWENG